MIKLTKIQSVKSHKVEVIEYKDIFNIVRSEQAKDKVSQILPIYEDYKVNPNKETKKLWALAKAEYLEAVMPTGVFNDTGADSLVELNNIVSLDIDAEHLVATSQEDLLSRLKSDSHVLQVWKSPSGDGIKVFFQTIQPAHNLSQKDYYEEYAWPFVKDYVLSTYGQNVDVKTFDVSRKCFISYDPEAYYNQDAKPLEVVISEKPEKNVELKPSTSLRDRILAKLPEAKLPSIEETEAILSDIPSDDMEKWLGVGGVLHKASNGSSQYKAIWDAWSARSDKFDQKNNDYMWESGFKNKPTTDITFGTIRFWQKEATGAVSNTIVSLESELPPLKCILDYEHLPLDHRNNLLNDFWLERQGTVAIVGATGAGKSSLSVQYGGHFAAGKETLGLKPNGCYKVLYLQCEDSENDLANQKQTLKQLLSKEELELVRKNFFHARLRGFRGDAFINAMRRYCDKIGPDIVIINPILKFFNGDPIAQDPVGEFVDQLDLTIKEHDCGLMMVCHPKKLGNDDTKVPPPEYSIFGSSAWGNHVRDTIFVKCHNASTNIYSMRVGKRSAQLGWRELYIQRGTDHRNQKWTVMPKQAQLLLQSSDPDIDSKEKILRAIPEYPQDATQKEIEAIVGLKYATVNEGLNELIESNKVKRLPPNNRTRGYRYCKNYDPDKEKQRLKSNIEGTVAALDTDTFLENLEANKNNN